MQYATVHADYFTLPIYNKRFSMLNYKRNAIIYLRQTYFYMYIMV
jgi:hypothetical protein